MSLHLSDQTQIYLHIHDIGCIDQLPQDYLSKCTWTCNEWAGKGTGEATACRCLDNWTKHKSCVPNTNGLVQDYCRRTCGNCPGKHNL